jgi:hypothetical protein
MTRLRRRGLELHLIVLVVALLVSIVPGSAGAVVREFLSGRDLILAWAIVLLIAALVWRIWPGRWLALIHYFSLFWVSQSLADLVRRLDLPGHVIPLDDRLLGGAMLIALWLTIGVAAAVLWLGPVAHDDMSDPARTTESG